MKITTEKMNLLLDDFTKAVKNKKYERIPYNDWRKLKTAGACVARVLTDERDGGTYVVLNHLKNGDEIMSFSADDKAFGEFLLGEIMKKGEIKLMPPKSNDTLNEILSYDSTCSSASSSTHSSSNYTIREYRDNTASSQIAVGSFDQVYDQSTSRSLSDTYVTRDDFEEMRAMLAKKADLMPTQEMQDIKKENKMKGFNFDFGPCTNNAVKMSLYGLAVKNAAGTWVSYNPVEDTIIDVDILNFDGAKYLYKIPTAIKDIAAGDVVVHAGKPMFVVSTAPKSLNVVDPVSGEKKEIMLTRSPFGFDFATKIVNFLGNFMNTTPTPDNPFGNMWMLMLAQSDNTSAMPDLLPLMLMSGNSAFTANPIMMYFLLGDKGDKDNLLPLMFMMNNPMAPATHSCDCAGPRGKAGTDA